MKAANSVEKDNKSHQSQKPKRKESLVMPLSEVDVVNAQTQKSEDSTVKAGLASTGNSRLGFNGTIGVVHGSQTVYDQGAEIMHKKLQESLVQTGDINHPDTKNIEKDYMTTLNVDQIRDYQDLKSGTYVPKTVQEQVTVTQSTQSNSETATVPVAPVEIAPVQNSMVSDAGLILPVEQEDATARTTPADPHSDPGFNQTVDLVKNTAKAKRTHTTKDKAEAQANAAAVVPGGERKSKARGQQVEQLDQQKTNPFKASDFKTRLADKINKMQLPKNEKEADNFEEHNNIAQVNQSAEADVVVSKNSVTGGIEAVAKQEPNESKIPQRITTALPDPKIGSKVNIKAISAVPPKRGDGELSEPITKGYKAVEQQFEANHITDEQLANSNEPTFINALNAKNAVRENAETAPGAFKAAENKKLENSKQEAQSKTNSSMEGMHHSRKEMLEGVVQKQHKAGEKNTDKNQDVVNELNKIYADTKKSVDGELNDLETKVTALFDIGAQIAKAAFEKYVSQKIDEYKEKRYGSWYDVTKYGKRIKDAWNGLPKEVEVFFTDGRKLFLQKLDGTINVIANLVTERLNRAKAAITSGRQKVVTFIKNLPADVKKAIKGDIDAIQGQFKELENSISDKEASLIDSLATKYSNTLKEVDDMIVDFKKHNQGLLGALKEATLGVWETIQNIRKTLTDLLSGALDVILSIIAHPIDFLSNLISGVSQGFSNFATNIWTHLKTGFFGWLTGSMKGISLTMPEDIFSLKGIFSITTQLLGLTWEGIRAIGSKVVGEPVMKVLETGFEMVQIIRKDGVAGLWEHLKDQFADLKETVMDAIMDIVQSQVIEAGIKWVMGLLTPVGAFVKAAMAIIDVVKFFIQRASQIMELVRAFTESIKAIASGNVGAVAKSIENALGKSIPVLIGFLASLLGISGLADKVIGVIHKIRERIVKAITKFWSFVKEKGGYLLGKLGIRKKEKETEKNVGNDTTKTWDDVQVSFEADDKHEHTLYFENKGGKTVLMVASTPKTFSDFVDGIRTENNDERTEKARTNAKKIAKDIDTRKNDATNGEKEREDKKKADILSMTKALSKFVAVLFGIDQQGGLPESEIIHLSKSTSGGVLGTSMRAKILTRRGVSGSEPKETNDIYKDLSYRMNGNGSYYVRGHLLNEHIHGEGILVNLTPLSQDGNKNHLRTAEEPIKIAVLGGAIIDYTLFVKYGQSIPEVNDDELERAGFESDEDKEKVRKIRKAEQHVPKGLTLQSSYLKKEGDKYIKEKELVAIKSILNPVDFDIKNYQINKVKKEKVSILLSSVENIEKNTGITADLLKPIKEAVLKIEGRITVNNIKEELSKIEKDARMLARLNRTVERLSDMNNVTLK